MNTAKHFDDRRSRIYDDIIRKVVPGYDVLHQMVAVELDQCVTEQADVLVAGCGTGAEIEVLAPSRPGWRFTGFDPSAEMLQAAAERMARLGVGDRVSLVKGGVEALPEDVAFDAATLILVMHFLPDDGAKQALLDGIGRRLRPGAPLVLVDLHGRAGERAFHRGMALWRQWQIAQGIPVEEVDKGFRRIIVDIHFVPETRMADLLAKAGFRGIERFWGALLFGGWVAWKV